MKSLTLKDLIERATEGYPDRFLLELNPRTVERLTWLGVETLGDLRK